MARALTFSAAVPVHALFQPLALAVAMAGLSLPLSVQAASAPAAAIAQEVPAGPLGRALSVFAARAGVALTFDPALTEGLSSPGLKGSYSVQEGFDRLLEGSGLEAVARADGYTLRQRPAAPRPAAAVTQPVELSSVVVVGSRTPQQISEIPGTVWVVDQQQIEAQTRAGVPLKEMLGILVPGLDIGPQGRTNYGQNMRGRGVLVMIDGVSLNSSRGISRQFDAIDPFNIERIEVLSGASAVYGGGATGGIINIITKRAHDPALAFSSEIGVRSGLRHSDDHDLRVAQSVSGGSEAVRGRLGVSLQQNGAAYGADNEQIRTDITQTDLQYNRTLDVLGTVDISLPAEQSLRLSAQYYDSGFNGDKALYLGPNLSGALGNPALLEMRKGFSSDVEPATERRMATADYHAPDVAGGQDLYVQLYAREEKMDFYPFPGRLRTSANTALPYYGASQQNTSDAGLKLALAKSWSSFKMTYGLDLNRERFDADQVLFNTGLSNASGGLDNQAVSKVGRYPKLAITGRAAFLQGEWRLTERLSVNAGLRRQRFDVRVGDFVQVDRQVLIANGDGISADAIPGGRNHYEVTLRNLGLVYKLNQTSQVWSSYSEGFELPDPGKYYGQGNYTRDAAGHWVLGSRISVAGSPLTGIKTRQLEAGWRHQKDGVKAQAAMFYSLSDKSISYNSTNLTINVQDQDKRNYGLEGELSWLSPRGMEVGANALVIRSQVKSGNDWRRQMVTDASPDKLVAFTGWRNDRAAARLQATHLRDVDDSAGNRLEGYTTLDLLGSYRTASLGRFSFGVQNLLDRDYTSTWSQRAKLFYAGQGVIPQVFDFSGRGRTFGLTWSHDY